MLPESWVSKIFDHMSSLYGAKFTELWKATDLEKVKRTWAEKLGGFEEQPLAIRDALDALDEKPWPPTLPEFLILCREAARRYGNAKPMLTHTPTAEERERSHQAAQAAAAAVKKDGRDHMGWAKAPRSQTALNSVVDGARTDSRLREILEVLIAEGVASPEGKLLRRAY